MDPLAGEGGKLARREFVDRLQHSCITRSVVSPVSQRFRSRWHARDDPTGR
jgi:hypothetical protein